MRVNPFFYLSGRQPPLHVSLVTCSGAARKLPIRSWGKPRTATCPATAAFITKRNQSIRPNNWRPLPVDRPSRRKPKWRRDRGSRAGKTKGHTIAVLGCRLRLPPELEREFIVVDFTLPGAEALDEVLRGIFKSTGKKRPSPESTAALIDAARGLTTTEAEDAFALSVVECGELNAVVIAREKAQAVKKNGLLELIETRDSLDSSGGLKDWLLKRREAFSPRAKEYGLPMPKGVLMLGIPGCGKSLTAKATASVFGVPLLRLDAGRIFAGLVGQSESNLRAVIQTAEAIAPCVLWIDELEKGFAGSRGSGSTDGGTSSRVFGSFISWMQEKRSPVFIVATANDVSQLPPEMLRKGALG